MNSKLLGLLAGLVIALSLWSTSSGAVLLTATQSATFKFDFSGQTPTPPYDAFSISFYFGSIDPNSFDPGDSLQYGVFDELGGSAALVDTASSSSSTNFLNVFENLAPPGIPSSDVDIFITVTALTGSFDLQGVSTQGGLASTGGTPFIEGSLVVPEPTILALLGIGFAGFGFANRRKAN